MRYVLISRSGLCGHRLHVTKVQTVWLGRTRNRQITFPMLLLYTQHMRYSYDMRNNIWREVNRELKTGSKQQQDTKERIKSLLAPKNTLQVSLRCPSTVPRPGDEQHLCALWLQRGQLICTGGLFTLLWWSASFDDFSDGWICLLRHHVELQMKCLQEYRG